MANVPASIALVRAELARRHGNAEQMGTFARQARACVSPDEQALCLQVDWDLAVADWLRGRLVEAEAALTGASRQASRPRASYILRCGPPATSVRSGRPSVTWMRR